MAHRILLILLSVFILFSADAQDTLRHIPKNTPLTFYTYSAPDWGYYAGHNYYGREIYGEKYEISGKAKLLGVISCHTGKISKPERPLAFEAYSVNTDHLPKAKLGSKDVTYGDIDLSGNPMTTLFDTPIIVEDSFFVALNFFLYAHEPFTDTIGILCSEDGSRPESDFVNYGRNFMKLHHGFWEDYKNKTGQALYLALYPIVEFLPAGVSTFAKNNVITINAPFPNPAKTEITIPFNLNQSSDVNFSLINFAGKTLNEMTIGFREKGFHEEKLPLPNIPPGEYFLLVETSLSTLGTKVIVE